MPNLNDVIEIAEALGTKAVFPVKDRCVAVRNRHSTCQRCMDVCPADAIRVEKNVLELDAAECVLCGACTAVCPVEALVPLLPDDKALASKTRLAMDDAGGAAVFACARIASKNLGDPAKYVELPCLVRMEEGFLVWLASQGVREIALVDGTCATCKHRHCVPRIQQMVSTANLILRVQGSDIQVQNHSEFPESILLEDKQGLFAESRRGFFTSMGSRAADAASETVKYLMGKNPENEVQRTLRDLFQVTGDGVMPQFEPERHGRLLDAMYEMGESVESELDSALFGSVEIDYDSCNACMMCTVFCPTGALSKSKIKPEDAEGSYVEFSVSDCVQCRLCADACLKKCLTVNTSVDTAELFDFEPRLILLPPKPKRMGTSYLRDRGKRT